MVTQWCLPAKEGMAELFTRAGKIDSISVSEFIKYHIKRVWYYEVLKSISTEICQEDDIYKLSYHLTQYSHAYQTKDLTIHSHAAESVRTIYSMLIFQ